MLLTGPITSNSSSQEQTQLSSNIKPVQSIIPLSGAESAGVLSMAYAYNPMTYATGQLHTAPQLASAKPNSSPVELSLNYFQTSIALYAIT